MAVWMGPIPAKCDTCGTPIEDTFIDGRTQMGPWAIMCPSCHSLGPGTGKLGTGFGQKYGKTIAGRFEKLA